VVLNEAQRQPLTVFVHFFDFFVEMQLPNRKEVQAKTVQKELTTCHSYELELEIIKKIERS
jgi:hypothetical protein